MPKLITYHRGRYFIYVDDIPLVGHIAFGVIDRGTNVLQVRPTTVCILNCIFCSVDAGPNSRHRQCEYIVDPHHLVKWFRYVYEAKHGEVIEALIDGVGEPPTHFAIVEIVRELKKIVPRVAMETRCVTLDETRIRMLEEAGLDRLNVSIDTLDPCKARYLQGVEWYDVERIKRLVEYIVRETNIDVHLTPVWIPGVNDKDIEKIIEWGLKIGVGKRFPPFGIQKYEIHRYGRKVPGVRDVSWSEFWRFLEKLEQKYGVPLIYKKLDFGIRRTTHRFPIYFRKGEMLVVEIVCPGWLKREAIAVDNQMRSVITVVGVDDSHRLIGRRIRVRIVENKDGIYIAKPA